MQTCNEAIRYVTYSIDCERDWDTDDGIVALRSSKIGSEIWRGRLR